MYLDELMELEQDITKAKFMADMFYSEVAEDTETDTLNYDSERLANMARILVDYLAAAKEKVERMEVTTYGKN